MDVGPSFCNYGIHRNILRVGMQGFLSPQFEADADGAGAWLKGFKCPVEKAAAVAETETLTIEADQWNQQEIGHQPIPLFGMWNSMAIGNQWRSEVPLTETQRLSLGRGDRERDFPAGPPERVHVGTAIDFALNWPAESDGAGRDRNDEPGKMV